MGKQQIMLIPLEVKTVEQQNQELKDKVVELEIRLQTLEQQIQGGVS